MRGADLSGPLNQQLQRTLAEARRLRDDGNYPAAAQAYRRGGQLQIQLADYALNKEIKTQQLQVAKTYLEMAERLERPNTAHVEPSGGDDLQAQVAALRTRVAITWDDIASLAETKTAIQSAYAFALVRRPPNVLHRPVNKILLYGPSGTGKTMLAAAASNELDAAFYSVKASDMLSKWFGESPRLISALYREAASNAPAVVFLEEFDALVPRRGDSDSGAERRIVSTLLAELEGIPSATTEGRYVLTVAATNLPWDIDPAILGRFGARLLYVPLPDATARAQIVEKHLIGRGYESTVSSRVLAQQTEGFSGRDLANLCSIAIEQMEVENNQEVLKLKSREALSRFELRIEPLTQMHFDYALARITPQAAVTDPRRYEEWRKQTDEK